MRHQIQNRLLLGALAVLTLVCVPSVSRAQVAYYAPAPTVVMRPVYRPLFPRIGWWRQPTVAYRPVVSAMPVTAMRPISAPSGCTTCYSPAPTTTCRYVPQTCYRAETVTVPVTTYRPVSSCDPCTGVTTTCMRPVTTYVQQTRRVPYTTYRMACSTSSCSTGNCSMGGCSTGQCSTGQCSTGAGSLEMGSSELGNAYGMEHTGDRTGRPTLSAERTEALKPEPTEESVKKREEETEPMQDIEINSSKGPELYDTNDKTASLDLSRPALRRVSLATPPTAPARNLDDSGWHAVSR